MNYTLNDALTNLPIVKGDKVIHVLLEHVKSPLVPSVEGYRLASLPLFGTFNGAHVQDNDDTTYVAQTSQTMAKRYAEGMGVDLVDCYLSEQSFNLILARGSRPGHVLDEVERIIDLHERTANADPARRAVLVQACAMDARGPDIGLLAPGGWSMANRSLEVSGVFKKIAKTLLGHGDEAAAMRRAEAIANAKRDSKRVPGSIYEQFYAMALTESFLRSVEQTSWTLKPSIPTERVNHAPELGQALTKIEEILQLSSGNKEAMEQCVMALEKRIANIQATLKVNTSGDPLARLPLMHEGVKNGMVATVFGPMEDEYGEFCIMIEDQDGNCCADVIVGLNPDMRLRVGVTTDGDGENEKNVNVFPMEPAENAVEVDIHNSMVCRQPAPRQ